MAERVVRVCDVCGDPADQSVTFRAGGRSLAQDLCDTHLQELVRRSHAPKRGRRPKATTAAAGRVSAATRRPRKARTARPSRKAGTAKTTRRRITDPTVLEKRRAALAKAREALAKKRADERKTG
jgi:hypothetical protein